jgi:hypothetical protein
VPCSDQINLKITLPNTPGWGNYPPISSQGLDLYQY